MTPLFEVIPVERKGRLARDLLRSEAEPFGSGHPVFWMLKEWQGPWGLELSREVLARLRERAAFEVDYQLSSVLGGFALRLAPALAEEAATGWPEHSGRWPLWAPAVNGMVSILRFRSEMLQEIQQ